MAAPVPSKRGNLARAMRNACSGPLYREAILETVYQGFYPPGSQFCHCTVDWSSIAQFRMGFRQPLSCIIMIVPHCFRGGDDTRQTLCAFALRDAKLAGASFVRGLRHDAIEVSIGFTGCNEDSAHGNAKSKFR